jgi:hypothetical protein
VGRSSPEIWRSAGANSDFSGFEGVALKILGKERGFRFGTGIAGRQGIRDQVKRALDQRMFGAERWRRVADSPSRGVSPTEPGSERLRSPRTILEASDWLLGAEGHLSGEGRWPYGFLNGVALHFFRGLEGWR